MAQAARLDVERAIPSVLQVLARRARYVPGDPSLQETRRDVLSGGGRIERAYGLGRQRVDLFIQWPRPEGEQRFVIEGKILRGSLDKTLEKDLPQIAGHMDRCAAAEGHLVIFDRSKKLWKEKVYRRIEEFDGTPIQVWERSLRVCNSETRCSQ